MATEESVPAPSPLHLYLGKTCYDQFCRALGGTGPKGGAAEEWQAMSDRERTAWQAAAEAVLRKAQQEGTSLPQTSGNLTDGTPKPAGTSNPPP